MLKSEPEPADTQIVIPARLRTYMAELPRRLHLVTALTSALIVAATLIGTAGLVDARTGAKALETRDAVEMSLDAVTTDVAQSQVNLALLANQPPSTAGFESIVTLHQVLKAAWTRYLVETRATGASTGDRAAVSAGILQTGAQVSHGTSVPSAQEVAQLSAAQLATLAVISDHLKVLSSEDQATRAAESKAQAADTSRYRQWLLLAGAAAVLLLVFGNTSIARGGRRYEKGVAERESDLAAAVATNEFEARLQRALDMSVTENRVYDVVRRAVEEAVPGVGVELLQADSSRAHFQQLVTTGDIADRRCSVESPADCPAAQRGAVLSFASSLAIDACPYLQEQATPCSAVCIPVSVAGTTTGVMHAAGPHGEQLDTHRRASLELVARRTSDRIGMLRAFALSEIQASTDPLTGLPNRRALEDKVRRLDQAQAGYAVAFGDLDRFKMLNDVHGHGAGDQALRLFARVLRGALRPQDLVGRYGGEEFVIVLPDCSEAEAVQVLERVRSDLAIALLEVGSPHFTVSFGVTQSQHGRPFEALVTAADAALLEAKARGRDRVEVAGATGAGATRQVLVDES